MKEASQEGRKELEQKMEQLCLLRLNEYAYKEKLISEEMFRRINVQLHSREIA